VNIGVFALTTEKENQKLLLAGEKSLSFAAVAISTTI
jgi:hypothetical protein